MRIGEESMAPVNGIELCYQEIGDPGGEPLLLVMGLSMQLIAWPDGFCEMLAERGFRVVRFDNRDVGRSTKMTSAGVPSDIDLMIGRRATAPYLLRDLAVDASGLLDHLGVESAHVVGASMGGMIAQTMAIVRPERVRSLVSMLSNTGDRRHGLPSLRAARILMSRQKPGRQVAIDRAVATFKAIGSPGFPIDEDKVRDIAARSYDRGHSAAGVIRQLHAITASGNRTQELRKLSLPATVLHGASDPLVRPSGGKATAAAIPDARLRIFEGMGHDLPEQLWPDFVEEIVATAERAGAARPLAA